MSTPPDVGDWATAVALLALLSAYVGCIGWRLLRRRRRVVGRADDLMAVANAVREPAPVRLQLVRNTVEGD